MRKKKTMLDDHTSKNPLFVDKDYQEAKKVFKTTASCLVHAELSKEFQWHQEAEMSSAKLAELIMCTLLRSMRRKK